MDPAASRVRRISSSEDLVPELKRQRTIESPQSNQIQRVQEVNNFSLVNFPQLFITADHARLIGAYLPIGFAIKLGSFPLISGSINRLKHESITQYLNGSKLRMYLEKEGRYLTSFKLGSKSIPKATFFGSHLNNLRELIVLGRFDNERLKAITVKVSGLRQLFLSDCVVDAKFGEVVAGLPLLNSLLLKESTLLLTDLTPLSRIRKLYFCDQAQLTVAHICAIATLTQLRNLGFSNNGLNDEKLMPLSSCTNLTKLDLSENKGIQGDGLIHLSVQLKSLWLSGINIIRGAALTRLRNLQCLYLSNSISVVRHLTSLQNLVALNHLGSVFNENDLSLMGRLTRLKRLDLSESQFTTAGLSAVGHLSKLTCLQELRIDRITVDTNDNLNNEQSEELTNNLLRIKHLTVLDFSLGCWNETVKYNVTCLSNKLAFFSLHLKGIEIETSTAQSFSSLTSLDTLTLESCHIGTPARAVLKQLKEAVQVNEEESSQADEEESS